MRFKSILKTALTIPFKFYSYILNLTLLRLNNVSIGKGWEINGIIQIINKGRIDIGRKFLVNSSKYANPIGGDTIMRLVVRKKGHLTIGNNVGISNSTIVCWNKVEIGNFVLIGGSCKIWDTDFHSTDPADRCHNDNANVKTGSVKISDYAFIGGSSIILKGVTIGKNAVVAAGSVVTKSIPDNEIWGGNPAKLIRRLK
jgi:acetyltransferase-like isoleucine patch superfamily enzyme